MKIKQSIQFALFLAAFLALASCSRKTDDNSNNAITKEVDRICDSILTATKLPGMVVGIWDGTKNFTYLKGKGYNDPNTHDPIKTTGAFRVGSNTKTMVVTCLLQLVDSGKVSLDDTIGKYFPGFKNGGLITVRMLCNMTSGIPNYSETKKFDDSLTYNPKKVWTPQQLVDLALDSTFTTPGSVVHYSNTNTTLIGMIIEQLTGGKSLGDNLQTRFYSKIPLPNTLFPTGTYMPSGSIRGFMNLHDTASYTDDVTEYYDISWAWAAGAAISDVNGLRTWVENLVNGTQISASLQSQRFDGQEIAPGVIYGLGMFTRGHDMWGHNGGLPGFTSVMMHHRTKNITYVIFYNWQHPKITPDWLYTRLLPVVNPEL